MKIIRGKRTEGSREGDMLLEPSIKQDSTASEKAAGERRAQQSSACFCEFMDSLVAFYGSMSKEEEQSK